MKRVEQYMTQVLNRIADIMGHSSTFAFMLVLIASWFVVGIFFQYDSTWFDIMDVFVFLMTFFLVFIVQSSQNADTQAMQDKLDEIIDSLDAADTKKEGEEKEMKRGTKRSR